ncbi:MAG: hypothetical protein H7175_10705, partial [Burkholderiales bacterium]|nr:hypothetical protein [Anaerolineae bacterium]
VITAPGSYGPSFLYVFADQEEDGIIKFQFTGFDEWGKTNTMEFKFCEPVGPISGGEVPPAEVNEGPQCTGTSPIEICLCVLTYCNETFTDPDEIGACIDEFLPRGACSA